MVIFYVTEHGSYFNEDKKSIEFGGNVKHKSSVGRKPLNIAFIACVDKDWPPLAPVAVVDEVLLVEDFGALGLESEMV